MPDLKQYWVARVVTLITLIGVSFEAAAGQEGDCGDRASLLVTVLDEYGSIALPGATVVLRWTDAERMPVREATDADGRLRVCVPRDASEAVVWAEFGDHSSGQAAPEGIVAGEEREVRLRILSSVRSGRLIGRVVDTETGRPVPTAAVSVVGRPTEAGSDRQGFFRLTGVPAGRHELQVYKGAASLPAEFGGSDSQCGVVVVWTK